MIKAVLVSTSDPALLDACLDLAAEYDNVYLEPSAIGPGSDDPEGNRLKFAMRRIKEEGLIERTIYGSDGPQSPGFVAAYVQATLGAMEEAGYTADEAQAVLSGNFARVFGVPEVEL